MSARQGRRQRGGSGAQLPIWNRYTPFHVWPPGCCLHPILYFKNVIPPSGFWPLLVFDPLLLNPGDGPALRNQTHSFTQSCVTIRISRSDSTVDDVMHFDFERKHFANRMFHFVAVFTVTWGFSQGAHLAKRGHLVTGQQSEKSLEMIVKPDMDVSGTRS